MNLRRIFASLVTRLLLLGLCLVVFGIVVRYYVLSDFLRDDLTSVVQEQQSALATYVARDVDYKIVQRLDLLERLAGTLPSALLGNPKRLGAWLKERHLEYPLFSAGLYVTDVRGAILAGYPAGPGMEKTVDVDGDAVRAALAGSPYIGRPHSGRSADGVDAPVLPMAAAIGNGTGRVRAVLVGLTALAARGFLDSLLDARIGTKSGGFLLVSPRDKLFVAASQPDMVLKPTPPLGVNVLLDRAMAGFRGAGITVNAEGIEEVAATASVPGAGWFVVARLPTSEAFATVGRLQHFLITHAALALLVFAALAVPGVYLVLRPLFHAAACAEAMTQQEIPLRALPVLRNDEVGHLVMAFNRLLAKLDGKQAELTRLAHHDILTGLPNRALLADRIEQALARARREETQIGLLFMDLDGFKDINDTLGHDAGDEALRQVTMRFARIGRQTDTLARVGGDEFVLLLGDLDGQEAKAAVTHVAAKCIAAMAAPFLLDGNECPLGVSVGIAVGNGRHSLDTFLQSADSAMYRAKEAGRGQYALCALDQSPVAAGSESDSGAADDADIVGEELSVQAC